MVGTTHDNTSALLPSDCLGFAIRKAARVMTQLYDEALAPTGLKSTQFSLLNVASADDGIGINQLAGKLVMDRTTLTRNLKPLAAEGLVKIRPGKDRRTRAVSLTAQGRRRLARALPLWRKAQAQALDRLGIELGTRLRNDLAEVVDLVR